MRFQILLFCLILILGCSAQNLSKEIDKGDNLTKSDPIQIIDGFTKPIGLNLDPQKNLYVCDIKADKVYMFKYEGSYPTSVSKAKIIGSFSSPHSIDFDSSGNIYVTEYLAKNTVTKLSSKGESLGSLGVTKDGFSDGFDNSDKINSGHLGLMKGIATSYFGTDGNLYVSDYTSGAIIRFKDGKYDGWLGSGDAWTMEGYPDYSGEPGRFSKPHMAIQDDLGYIYIVDTGNHRIQKFSNDGDFIGWIGASKDGPTDGWSKTGMSVVSSALGGFDDPVAIDLFDKGFVVADRNNHRVQMFSKEGKFLGWFGGKGETHTKGWEKTGSSIQGSSPGFFSSVFDVKYDGNTLYVADITNRNVQIIDIGQLS